MHRRYLTLPFLHQYVIRFNPICHHHHSIHPDTRIGDGTVLQNRSKARPVKKLGKYRRYVFAHRFPAYVQVPLLLWIHSFELNISSSAHQHTYLVSKHSNKTLARFVGVRWATENLKLLCDSRWPSLHHSTTRNWPSIMISRWWMTLTTTTYSKYYLTWVHAIGLTFSLESKFALDR